MQLLPSWKDGFALCKPEHAKLLFLLVFNACWKTVKLYPYFWWMFIPVVSVMVGTKLTYWPLLSVFPLFLLIFSIYLAARPSTLKKDWLYFLSYGKHFIWFCLFFILWLVVLCCLHLLGWITWSFSLPLHAPYMPLFSMTTFFLLDSDGSWSSARASLYRGLLYVMYNAPICIILAGIFWIFWYALTLVCCWAAVLMVLVWPLAIAVYNTLYIKRIHEQFQLYFGTYHAE